MQITLDYWIPHREPEVLKQEPYGLYIYLSKDNFGGEAKEALFQITGTTSKGADTEKGEHKTVRAAKNWSYDLQVLYRLTRYKDPLLQPVRTCKS